MLQNRTENQAIVSQIDVFDTRANVQQRGNRNTAFVDQILTGPGLVRAVVQQTGNANDALVLQDGVSNSTVRIEQGVVPFGGGNDAFNSFASASQLAGNNLVANINQEGSFQTANTVQSGTYGEANILQTGAGHNAFVLQTNEGSSLAERNLVNITQSGNFAGGALAGHSASAIQFGGHSNTINITQQ